MNKADLWLFGWNVVLFTANVVLVVVGFISDIPWTAIGCAAMAVWCGVDAVRYYSRLTS